jgi:hypothetical protein
MQSKRLLTFVLLVITALSVAACGSAPAEPTATPADTATLPAIELLAGQADTCRVPNDEQSTLVGFDARYVAVTTENVVNIILADMDGNVLVADSFNMETNQDGESGWGFYPAQYDVPDDSSITATLTVQADDAPDSPITSTSVLTYNCTTGETVTSSFDYTE